MSITRRKFLLTTAAVLAPIAGAAVTAPVFKPRTLAEEMEAARRFFEKDNLAVHYVFDGEL